MKIKVIFWLSASLLLTSVFYILICDKKPFQKIIYDNHLSQSFNLIKSVVVPVVKDNQNYYLYNNLEKSDYTIDQESSTQLTWNALPPLFNDHLLTNQSLPILVTVVKRGEVTLLKALLKSIQKFYSQAFLLIFDVHLDRGESDEVSLPSSSSSSLTLLTSVTICFFIYLSFLFFGLFLI